jgi:hypothetical protein
MGSLQLPGQPAEDAAHHWSATWRWPSPLAAEGADVVLDQTYLALSQVASEKKRKETTKR